MKEIFEIWPSMAEMARCLDVYQGLVASWKRYGSIPAKYDLKIIEQAKIRGVTVTFEQLARVRPNKTG